MNFNFSIKFSNMITYFAKYYTVNTCIEKIICNRIVGQRESNLSLL